MMINVLLYLMMQLVQPTGKYAAVWPIIGVIVEVIALIVIIATYEYFRSKKRREEEAAERTEHMYVD